VGRPALGLLSSRSVSCQCAFVSRRAPRREVAGEPREREQDDASVALRRLTVVRGRIPPRGEEELRPGECLVLLHVLEGSDEVFEGQQSRGDTVGEQLAAERQLGLASTLYV